MQREKESQEASPTTDRAHTKPASMKRGAARQIQREDGDDPHAVDGDAPLSNGDGAESRSIASRPIRGLPKKKTDSSTSSSAANSFSSTPFTFGGFGSSTANPPAVSTSSSTPLSSSGFTFGTSSTSFASNPATTTSFAFSSPAPASNGHVKVNEDATEELEYYCSLRGLNISLQSQLSEAVSKELERDTFADLSVLLKSAISRYSSFRSDAEEKRKKAASAKTASTPAQSQAQAPPASMPLSSVSTSRESQSSKSAAVSAAEKVATSQTSLSATAPTFTPPKLPSSGGFTFAGSSFTAPTPTTLSGAAKDLLPGQPTFSLPKTGFYSTFGKNDGDDDDEGGDDAEEEDEDGNGEEDDDGQNEEDDEGGDSVTNEEHKEVGQQITTAAPSFTAPSPFTPASTTGAGFSSSSTKAQPFSFSSAPTSAFSFGSASKPAASSLSATADPAPTISSSSTNSPFRFSFGSNKADNTFGGAAVSTSDQSSTKETSEGTSANTPSSFLSPSKVPAIGSNFANTSGVKQGGAFTFGSGKINFGTPSPSPFGSSSTSTGFTFGSSPSKQNESGGK